jgi:hypothetical protein
MVLLLPDCVPLLHLGLLLKAKLAERGSVKTPPLSQQRAAEQHGRQAPPSHTAHAVARWFVSPYHGSHREH